MTKRELAECLGFNEFTVLHMFQKAAKNDDDISKNIKLKNTKSSKSKHIDYTLDEVLYVMEDSEYTNKMQIQYVKENFVERSTAYKYKDKTPRLTKDERDFIHLITTVNTICCVCNTCMYLQARKYNKAGSGFHPYCSFYQFFLAKKKINVYKDRCKTHVFKSGKHTIWSQINFTPVDKILGIDRNEFISKRESNEEPIVLLSDGRKNYEDFN